MGAGTRIAAWGLDLVFIIILMVVLGQFEVDILPNLTSIDTSAGAIAVIIYVFWTTTIFYFVIELLAGASPGKLILGLKTSRSDGEPATLGRRIVRYVGKIFLFMFIPPFGLTESDFVIWPLLALSAVSFLGAFLIFGPKKQPLYDLIAGTAVFRKEKSAAGPT